MTHGIVIAAGATRIGIVNSRIFMSIRQISLLSLLLLTACATGPKFDSSMFQQDITPEEAIQDMDTYLHRNVMWGGLLVSTTNLDQSTQLEVLAYPLNSKQKPDTSRQPHGRFIVLEERFLEPIDYSEGRIITVIGILTGVRSGVVGAAQYQFPVVDAEEIYLWLKNSGSTEPRVHFGFGIISGT
ncbi:MAG: Slp family lipoprotein [bacterium]